MRNRILTGIALFGLMCSSASAQDTRYRGFTVGRDITATGIADARSDWKANVIQYQIHNPDAAKQSPEEYLAALQSSISILDTVIAQAAANPGMKVVVNLQTPPGGYVDESVVPPVHRVYTDIAYQNALIEAWRRLAAHYKGNSTVWAYQVVSEPAVPRGVTAPLLDLPKLVDRLVTVIRSEVGDTGHPIFVQPPFANPDLLNSSLTTKVAAINRKARAPVVGIGIHFYPVLKYQQQGLYSNPYPAAYPGKAALVKKARKVQAAQAKYVKPAKRRGNPAKLLAGWFPVYVGEFAVARWAPDAATFVTDATSIFDAYGWHATYHVFRDAVPYAHCKEPTSEKPLPPGDEQFKYPWDPELSTLPSTTACSSSTTPVGSALRTFFSQNK